MLGDEEPWQGQDADFEFTGITDFSPWDGMDVFAPHEAACLLAGISPHFKKSKRPDIAKITDELCQIVFERQSNDSTLADIPLLQVLIEDMTVYCSRNGLRSNFLSYRKKPIKAPDSNAYDELKRELNNVKSQLDEARQNQKPEIQAPSTSPDKHFFTKLQTALISVLSQKQKNQSEIQAPCMSPDHKLFASELETANAVWTVLFSPGEDVKEKGRASKTLIRRWLDANRPRLSDEAKNRIEIVANPDRYKSGGAPKMD